VFLVLSAFAPITLADVIVGTNGERFVGTIIEEREDVVVHESETAGPLAVPRGWITEIERTVGNSVKELSATDADWLPPGVGLNGCYWIQLDTAEWLKGRLRYAQKRTIDFESDKLEDLTMEWKDIKRIYTGQPMFAKFDDHELLYGSIVVSSQMVIVNGP
jgi:hypothetical protein